MSLRLARYRIRIVSVLRLPPKAVVGISQCSREKVCYSEGIGTCAYSSAILARSKREVSKWTTKES